METPQRTVPEAHLPLSELLLTVARGPGDTTTLGEIVSHFGPRAFGAVLFVFAVPNLLPLPPGTSTLLGLPLLLIAPQLAFGGHRPWIPKRMARQAVDRETITRVCRRAAPWVERAEQVTKRRLGFMFAGPGDAAIGIVCTLLAAVLILPIPLGNMLPAAAVVALSLSLTQRDGLLTIIGYLIAAVSTGVLVMSAQLVMAAVIRLGLITDLW